MHTNIEDALDQIGQMEDDQIDLASAALTLSRLTRPAIHYDRYRNHLAKIAHDVGERYQSLIKTGARDDALTKLAALKHVLSDQEGYKGDTENYNALENADLTRVIDRRRGLPITLAILYIHAGRLQGWTIQGVNFPGHFIVRLEQDGQRVLFDPFYDVKILEAADLRHYLKAALGPKAELSVTYYAEATNRDILVRLQNNIKLRQIEAEDYEAALQTLKALKRVDPLENRFLFDEGIIYARLGQYQGALAALGDYVRKAPEARDRTEAQGLMNYIRQLMQ